MDTRVDYEQLRRVGLAVAALRAFGNDLDRASAARVFPLWRHYGTLTDEQRAAVLARFPERTVRR